MPGIEDIQLPLWRAASYSCCTAPERNPQALWPSSGFPGGSVSPARSCFHEGTLFTVSLSLTFSLLLGSGAVSIDVLGDQGQGVELVCRSQGWFPKPIVQWVTKNMQHLSPDTAVHQDNEQFFSVLSRVVVSGEEMGEIGCQIQNNLMQKGEDFSITLSGAP